MPRSLFRSTGRTGLLACAWSIAVWGGPLSAQQQQLEIPLAPLPDKKAPLQFDPSDAYFNGWLLFKDGEKLQADKKYVEALEKFTRARQLFDNVATYYPTWKRDMVGGRRAKVLDVIGQIGPLALKENEKQARAVAELEGGVRSGVVESDAPKPLKSTLPEAPLKPTREVETLESRRIAELEKKVEDLQADLAAKPPPANGAEREAARARDIAAQRDVARAELKRANDELSQLRARNAAAPMQEELSKLNAQLQALEQQKAAMGQALGKSQEETKSAREQIAALQAERGRLLQQTSDLQRNLEEERKRQNEVVTGQQKQLRGYQEELRDAENKLATANQRIASLENQLSEVRSSFEELYEQHEGLLREREQMAALLNLNKDSQIQTLIDQSMSYRKQLRESEEKVKRLEQDTTANQDLYVEALRDLGIAKGNINDFQHEKAAQEKRLADLEARLRSEDKSLAQNNGADPAEVETLRGIIQKQLRIQERRRQASEILLDAVSEKAKNDPKIADALSLYQGSELPLSADELKLVQERPVDDTFVSPVRKSQAEVDANVAQLEQENIPYTDAAKRAYLSGRFEPCRELYDMVLERNPGDTDTMCRLGNVNLRREKPLEAADVFKKAIEIDRNNPYAHRMLGYSLMQAGDLGEALGSLQKSVELAPTNADGRVLLGKLYFDVGQDEQAEEQFKSAIGCDETMHQAYFNLAYLYAKQGKKKQGLEYYRNAIERGAEPDLELEKRLANSPK